MKPRNKPLSCRITRDGVLRIEIGVDTLAFSTLHSPFIFETAGDGASREDIAKRFKITNARGFAVDVKRELLDEAEDGSSLLTDLFDKATQKAIEEGAEHFFDTEDE